MRIADIPPSQACELIWGITARFRAAKDRQPFRTIKTQVHLTIDEARVLYAGWRWLEKYDGWAVEAQKAGGKVGVEDTDYSLSHCTRFIGELISGMDKDSEDKVIVLTERGMAIIDTAARHLDHYGLLLSFKDRPTGKWKGKK